MELSPIVVKLKKDFTQWGFDYDKKRKTFKKK